MKEPAYITKRILYEEMSEIRDFPEEEREELVEMFKKDGWPPHLALEMSHVAAKDSSLMLKEMAYRELAIFPESAINPIWNGVAMFTASAAHELFQCGISLFPDEDNWSIVKLLERIAETEVTWN